MLIEDKAMKNKAINIIIGNLNRLLFLISLPFLFLSCNYIQGEQKAVGYDSPTNTNGRNDAWGFVGPGGGGAMFNPAINPLDPQNIFVSCDMTGSYVTYDGGEKWRMFNLRGVVKFYSFDRENPSVVYAGTSNMLFKSVDKGVSWSTIYPAPSDVVTIHSQGDHASELVVTKDSIITNLEKAIVDFHNPKRLYLLVRKRKIDFWPPKRGRNSRYYTAILISEDGGVHWEESDRLRFELNNIFIDPTSPLENRTIYVSGKGGLGMKKNGQWSNLALPVNAGPITQYADGYDTLQKQHIIYAISGRSYFNPAGNDAESGIYMTTNNGFSWSRVDKSLLAFKDQGAETPEFRSIATSYLHPQTIYISYANLKIDKDSLSIGVAKSNDYGNSWKLVWKDVNSTPAQNRISGWLDERFGPGWGENPFHMSIDESNADVCYATDFGRTLKTTDGGASWHQVYTKKTEFGGWKSRGLQVTTGYMLAFDPFDSLHVFMADTDTGLMESFDGGQSWSSATFQNGVPKRWVNTTYWLLFDPTVKGKVWALMSANHDLPRPKMWRNRDMSTYLGGILKSEDGGKTWEPQSEAIGQFAPTHIIMDNQVKSDSRTLYVCGFGKGVYKSTDDGATWQLKNKGIEGSQPAAWRLTQNVNGDLYLIVFRKSEDGSIGDEKDGALYKSTDGAESWTKLELPEDVNGPSNLIIDPSNPRRFLLAAWGRYGKTEFSADRGGGIYVSKDDARSWRPVFTRDQHIHDLTVDQTSGVFYACGFNSSAYRSEDQGETWRRLKGYNFKWGKRVQPDPFDAEKVYIITFGGGIWHGPAKGDPAALEDIVTEQTSYSSLSNVVQ